jgi:hypothetical protein
LPMPMQCCPMQCVMQMRKNVCLSLLPCPGEDRVRAFVLGSWHAWAAKAKDTVQWLITVRWQGTA